jgi:hypothetical protein
MYSFDWLEPVQEQIETQIKVDRLVYKSYYKLIETYLSKFTGNTSEALYLGGSIATDLINNNPRSYEDYQYDIFGEDPFRHSNNLVNFIDANLHVDSQSEKYLMFLKTSIPGIKYQIAVDGRIIANIFKLQEKSWGLITPILLKSYYQFDILVISPELLLIDIYRNLYLPSEAENWEEILDNESKLFHYLQKIVRGANEEKNEENKITNDNRKELELSLIQNFVMNNPNIVLLSDLALKISLQIEKNSTIIQIISQATIEEDFAKIEKIVKQTLKRNIPVIHKTRGIHILADFRLRRTTIKVGVEEKEIMYVYNSANYDLIPFNKMPDPNGNFIQIGNPFVLLRFQLIDYWMIKYVRNLGSIDEHFAKQRLGAILDKLLKYRNLMSHVSLGANSKKRKIDIATKFIDSASGGMTIFQSLTTSYIGVFSDEQISQKILIKDLTKKYFDYYPVEYKKKNSEYRII